MSLPAPTAARGKRRDDAPGYVTGTNATPMRSLSN